MARRSPKDPRPRWSATRKSSRPTSESITVPDAGERGRSVAPDGPLLEVRDLQVSYGSGVLALQGVSLEVNPGEVVALVGANGAGKTTLLKTIAGLIEPLAGEIRFGGRRLDQVDGSDRVRLGVSLVPE